MQIICLSDTHGINQPKDLPDGDILIHAGDLSMLGEVHEIEHALAWLRRFPHKYKIVIGGNHDNALAEMPGLFKQQFLPYKNETPLIYLHGTDTMIRLEDRAFRIFGSSALPFNPIFRAGARAYMLDATTVRHWNLAPSCDILVTHGPPLGILDHGYGDPTLAIYVQQVKPKLHVFGHVHVARGEAKTVNTHFVNAAMVDEGYRSTHDPIIVEI